MTAKSGKSAMVTEPNPELEAALQALVQKYGSCPVVTRVLRAALGLPK
jgi:hypothetical protein